MDRVKQTMIDANKFSLCTVATVSILLFLLQDLIITGFSATEDAAELVSLFCTWLAISFVFNGTLFIANATFNNLGYPHYSTMFNIVKATIGTIPFVYFGAKYAGAPGVLAGQAIGTVIVGITALIICIYMIKKCSGKDGPVPGPRKKLFNPRIPIWPQTNSRG
jgi:Na+-driven multidrug efflux pump